MFTYPSIYDTETLSTPQEPSHFAYMSVDCSRNKTQGGRMYRDGGHIN